MRTLIHLAAGLRTTLRRRGLVTSEEPPTMHALQLKGPFDFDHRTDAPAPQPGPGQISAVVSARSPT